MDRESTEVTQLLKAWSEGNSVALEELTPKVYLVLRRAADKYMRNEKAGNTLQATALVHEVFLRLIQVESISWRDRAHFFAVSANMMPRILVDRARAKGMGKRGNQAMHLNLDDAPQIAEPFQERRDRRHRRRSRRAGENRPSKARVVELRFFGGLSVEETAEVLAISPQSVMRDWRMARAWLLAQLTGAYGRHRNRLPMDGASWIGHAVKIDLG